MAKDFTKDLLNPEFFEHKEGKVAPFNDKSGGPIDPFGDWEKKEKDALDMNAGEAFQKKDLSKIDVMGTEMPTKTASQNKQRSDNKGDHFKTEVDNCDIAPYGTEAGKSAGSQVKRA